jgi:hypothetical protein
VAFNVSPPSAQAAAGTTQNTPVGAIRDVLKFVAIIGGAGGLGGGLLNYHGVLGLVRRLRGGGAI